MFSEVICRVLGHRWESEPHAVFKLTGGRTAKVYRCGRCLNMNRTEITTLRVDTRRVLR